MTRARAKLATHRLEIDGRTIEYRVRISERARLLRIQIRADDGLTVIVPRGTGTAAVTGALRSHARWIFDRLDAAEKRRTEVPTLTDGSLLPYRGGSLRLNVVLFESGVLGVRCLNGTLRVFVPEAHQTQLAGLVEQWYRREALRLIAPRLAHWSAEFQAKTGRLSIRSQRTLWASCSSRGTLSFNWRLVAAPPEVLDYVIVHELTHLEEMNHSRRFWKLVADRCPDYLRQKTWLKANAGRLLNWP